MSMNSVQSTTPFEQIARSLGDRFDANRDGQLTTEEFTTFLTTAASSDVIRAAGSGRARGWQFHDTRS